MVLQRCEPPGYLSFALALFGWWQYVRLPKVLWHVFLDSRFVRQVATELHHQVTYLTRLDIQPQGKLSSNECTECWPLLIIYCNILSNMYNDVQCIYMGPNDWKMQLLGTSTAKQLNIKPSKTNACRTPLSLNSCLGPGSHDHRICRARWAQWYGLPKARQ